MKIKLIPPLVIAIIIIIGVIAYTRLPKKITNQSSTLISNPTNFTSPMNESDTLSIEYMRNRNYPGSDIVIEQTLSPGSNYRRYIASYQSDGLKIYALLTIPQGEKPVAGWPVILFNHGYIPPSDYATESSYAAYLNYFASSGYIVFKPDYRGNGNSDGIPKQIYVSPDYVTDSLNALSSIKKSKDADPSKIGVFGHSMGGNITLHELVISNDIKAAVIMSGVVGDEAGILSWWDQRIKARSIIGNDLDTSHLVQKLITDQGTLAANPSYWDSIDPTKYISDISVPVAIHVGTSDTAVPPAFSASLRVALEKAGKTVEFFSYTGDNHNLSHNLDIALRRSVEFFDRYLK